VVLGFLTAGEREDHHEQNALHGFPFAIAAAAFFSTERASARASGVVARELQHRAADHAAVEERDAVGSVCSPPAPSSGAMLPRSSPMNLRMRRLIAGSRSAAVTRPSITRERRLSPAAAAMPSASETVRACASSPASLPIE
jgi:hypothetical protein